MKYRKKPVIVDAQQWFKNGDHPDDDCTTFEAPVLGSTNCTEPVLTEGKIVRRFRNPDVGGEIVCKNCDYIMYWHGWVETLEGGQVVCPGDWIIKGHSDKHGVHYWAVKDDYFKKSYERVE